MRTYHPTIKLISHLASLAGMAFPLRTALKSQFFSEAMSSLMCNATQCVFTRVDTNNYGPDPNIQIPSYPPGFSPIDVSNATSFPTPSNTVFANQSDNTFNQTAENTTAPWNDAANQDMLTETVALTRDYRGGLFNALTPSDQFNYFAPSNTEWAFLPEGKTFNESRCSLTYCLWSDCFAGGDPIVGVGKPAVVRLIRENVYYNIMFTNWTSDYQGQSQNDAIPPPSVNDPFLPSPSFPYPAPNQGPGGGFSYVRSAKSSRLAGLPECPNCALAAADPAVIKGRIDDNFVNVSITGVTPAKAVIVIKAVGQDRDNRCNLPRAANSTSGGVFRPNARLDKNSSTVLLRRTLVPGDLSAFRYTVYFTATTVAGSCSSSVAVCVPYPGLDCDSFSFGYDATATESCAF